MFGARAKWFSDGRVVVEKNVPSTKNRKLN
jgi:ribosome-associated protein YbcJ (S4-like RNA binding protein)